MINEEYFLVRGVRRGKRAALLSLHKADVSRAGEIGDKGMTLVEKYLERKTLKDRLV